MVVLWKDYSSCLNGSILKETETLVRILERLRVLQENYVFSPCLMIEIKCN